MKRMMTITLATLTITLLWAGSALAADAPDYSQPAMLAFTQEVLRQRAAERIDVDLGAIDIYHFGVHTRLFWLPFLAPLPGTKLNQTATLPSPFALTNTAIARSMPYMGDDENSSAVNKRPISGFAPSTSKKSRDTRAKAPRMGSAFSTPMVTVPVLYAASFDSDVSSRW